MRIDIQYQGLDLEVVFYSDGEPYEIRNMDGQDIQHVFTSGVCDEIYDKAWERLNDPNNEANFREPHHFTC